MEAGQLVAELVSNCVPCALEVPVQEVVEAALLGEVELRLQLQQSLYVLGHRWARPQHDQCAIRLAQCAIPAGNQCGC